MNTIADEILRHLQPLIGLRLSITRRTADMRIFHFGQVRSVKNGTVGEYALHIQCPWRIESPQGIVTGRFDLQEPADTDAPIDWDTWDYDKDQNFQDKLIGTWLGNYYPTMRSFAHPIDDLIVEAVHADAYGGATIELSRGYRLVLFPAGTRGEDWRIFRPGSDEPHFVVEGGRIVPDTEVRPNTACT